MKIAIKYKSKAHRVRVAILPSKDHWNWFNHQMVLRYGPNWRRNQELEG